MTAPSDPPNVPTLSSTAPPRPRAVAVGVPYLTLLWAAVVAFGPGFDLREALLPMIFWTVVWYLVLYRAWRGGPMALRSVSLLATVIPGVMIFGVLMLASIMRSFDGPTGGLSPTTVLVAVGFVGALVVGIALRRDDVRAWSIALHPPTTRAAAAALGVVQPAAALATPDPASTESAAVADRATTEPYVLDVGTQLRSQARFRIGCFGALFVFFPGIPVIIGTVTVIRDGDPTYLLAAGGILALLVLCLTVSVTRFRRRHSSDAVMTIDRDGITWSSGSDRADLPWPSVTGVGISYHMALTRGGRKMHLPQLDIFEDPTGARGRWPWLDARRRQETPPRPSLPPERIRLVLPFTDDVHRNVEAAVRAHRPEAWLGWFERARSDTPWFLR